MQRPDIFQIIFEHATIGILIAKSNGDIVLANRFMEHLFGYEPNELEGQKIETLIPDSLHASHIKHRENYHKKPVERTMGAGLNLMGKRKNGTTFTIKISLGHTEFEGEKMAMAYINNAEKQKEADEAVIKEKDSKQMYLDMAGSMIVVLDKEGNITLLNQTGEEILGVSEEAVIGCNWIDSFIPADEKEKVRKVFDRLMFKKATNVDYLENWVVTKSSNRRLISWHNRILLDERGEVKGKISSGVDITERKEHEQKIIAYYLDLEQKVKERTTELEASKIKLSNAQAIAKIGHWDWWAKEKRLVLSKGMYQILDFKEGRIYTYEQFSSCFHPDDARLIREEIEETTLQRDGNSKNFRIITPKNNLKILQSNLQKPVFDKKGELVRVFGVMKDITEQKNVEILLQKSLNKEIELGELKSRFVSMASHEFRTPLSSILSSAELIQMYVEANKLEKIAKNSNRIKSSVRNLIGILNDFLSLEKLEAGKVEVLTEEVHSSDFIEELEEEVNPILQVGQQLICQIDEQIMQTDPYLLKNILLNLLSNAIKYSPNGEDVTLTFKQENNALIIRVIDEGIGIPEADHQYMFTRFFRASNVEIIKGTGLGLTIVNRYLTLLGGSISFESTLGKGSTFILRLPNRKMVV
ncbi:MAG: PAS domain S-box-containing protein [Paraglaciecola sp.]